MRIIPDDNKCNFLIDNEQTEYLDVNISDTIPITDDEWDEIAERYQCYSAMYCETSDWMPFSEYLKVLIELKIAEKEKK